MTSASRRCRFCRSFLRNATDRCSDCGRFVEVMRNDMEDVKRYALDFVDEAMRGSLSRESTRQELEQQGVPCELFEDRLNSMSDARTRSIRRWGRGQVGLGIALIMLATIVTAGTFFVASQSGGTYVITIGLFVAGGAALWRGLKSLAYRD